MLTSAVVSSGVPEDGDGDGDGNGDVGDGVVLDVPRSRRE